MTNRISQHIVVMEDEVLIIENSVQINSHIDTSVAVIQSIHLVQGDISDQETPMHKDLADNILLSMCSRSQ